MQKQPKIQKQTKAKTFAKLWTIAALTLVALFTCSLFIDPVRILHPHFKPYYMNDPRGSYTRALAFEQFDSLIMGTSMLQNTDAKDANKILSGKWVNNSTSSADFYERKLMLNWLLKRQKIKHIIYSFDDVYIKKYKGAKGYKLQNWDYLYDENELNNLQYFTNIKLNFAVFKLCIIDQKCATSLDAPKSWQKGYTTRFGGLNRWFFDNMSQKRKIYLQKWYKKMRRALYTKPQKPTMHNWKKIKKYLDETLIQLIAQNPNTKFTLIIPPYHRVFHLSSPQKQRYHELAIRYIAKATKTHKNLELYGWDHWNFTSNIAYYKDFGHFHSSINKKMLHWIKAKKGKITAKNVNNYIQKRRLAHKKFDLPKFLKQYKNLATQKGVRM